MAPVALTQDAVELPARLLGNRRHQRDVHAPKAVLLGDLEQSGHPRIDRLVDRVADAKGSPAWRSAPRPRSGSADAGMLDLGRVGDRGGEDPRGAFRGSDEDGADAEDPGGHRALQRLGSAQVGQSRGNRARRHAMFDERDQHRVERHRLLWGREASHDLQVRHVSEADVPEQSARQIAPSDDDLVGRAPAHLGPIGLRGRGMTLLARGGSISSERPLEAAGGPGSPPNSCSRPATMSSSVSAWPACASSEPRGVQVRIHSTLPPPMTNTWPVTPSDSSLAR